MSGKPVARLGDMTECPKDKHGGNPIIEGSPDVLIEGIPAARMGDATACGSTLVAWSQRQRDDQRQARRNIG